jgi:hypothetical protein
MLDLVEVVDRQFKHLESLDGFQPLVGLPRLLAFLTREPRISGVAGEMRAEARNREAFHAEKERTALAEVTSIWQSRRETILSLSPKHDDALGATFGLGSIDKLLGAPAEPFFPMMFEPGIERSRIARLVETIHSVSDFALTEARKVSEEYQEEISGIFRALWQIRTVHLQCLSQLWIDGRTLGGLALERLCYAAELLTPLLTDAAFRDPKLAPRLGDWLNFRDALKHLHGSEKSDKGERALGEVVSQVKRDLTRTREELCTRLAMGRSSLSLMRRFGARCERFEAARLRELAQHNSRKAEEVLTAEFARYLFDNGMNPFVDAKHGALRPDVLDPQHSHAPIYIEAKQYGARQKNLRDVMRRAAGQVWDTWGRLLNTYPRMDEAFLVVFRTGGPRLILPESISMGTRRLWLLLVDIAPATESGSRQKERALELGVQELQPLP